jgi:tRNA-dihydrouridine synthase A
MNAFPQTSAHRFCVAPMMDWTDRHCRAFHRVLTRHAVLYTEMVTSAAIRHGDRRQLLAFSPVEGAVALQLGGADAAELALAARIGEDFGYAEINLNCGCPSDRVREGRFGACLMAEPRRVAECVAAMRTAVNVPVTVKCRLGIDEQDEGEPLDLFIAAITEAGCSTVIVHARKAWLKGLSPRENREVPPLNHERVFRLKRDNPGLTVVLNGGIANLADAVGHLDHVDGVMLGRAAYETPFILSEVDHLFYGRGDGSPTREDIALAFLPYVEDELSRGTSLHRITRHMLGLFHGQHGGRRFRRIISEEAHRPAAGVEVLERALAATRATRTLQAAE